MSVPRESKEFGFKDEPIAKTRSDSYSESTKQFAGPVPVVIDGDVEAQRAPSLRRDSAITVEGPSLEFHGITYTVQDKKTKATKKILDNVSGVVDGGTIMYVMGPSGAGKSTMLDALAGRLKGDVTGRITVDGEVLSHKKFVLMSKYVQQEDVHIPILTVRETLMYTASLYTSDSAEVKKRVDDAINLLGLEGQKNTKVGNFLLRGLSGGQKRRLSVGVELVAKPRVLFLDEPTSGLDSTSAFSVIDSLKQISRLSGTTMMITIHQPAERLYLKADSLLLLSGGRSAFCGPVTEAVEWMGQLGHKPPPMRSSSEFLLDLVNADFAEDSSQVSNILDKWNERSDPIHHQPSSHEEVFETTWPTGFAWQTWILSKRMFLNALRNPLVIWLRMALYGVLSLMIGTVWLRIGEDTPSAGVIQDIIGALFFAAAFMVFMSVSVLPAYHEEKMVFIRERANGTYRVAAYNLAHFLVDIPFVLLLAVVTGSIVYWLVALNTGGEQAIYFLLALFLAFLVAESLMVLIASMVPDPIIGIAAGAMVFGGFMVVQGFFIKIEQIGWWWRWMHYISLHYYSFAGIMYNEFHGRTFEADPFNKGGPLAATTGDAVLAQYDLDETEKWWNLLVLVAMAVVYRAMAFVHMYFAHTGRH